MADSRKEAIKEKLASTRKEFLNTISGLTDEQWATRA